MRRQIGAIALKKFLILIMVWSHSIFAEEVDDLYISLVPIPDQTLASRHQGINDALKNVLVKLTGNSAVIQLAAVQPSLKNATLYVDAISFEALPNNLSIYDNTDGLNLGLRVNFSHSAIDNLIRRSELPVLPSNRPKLIFWIVRDDVETGRRLLGEDTKGDSFTDADEQLMTDLSRVMEDRGIPFILPSLDLEDQLTLSEGEAWNLASEKIEIASERYGADARVAIRFYRSSNGKIRGSWKYWANNKSYFDDFGVESDVSFIPPVINELIDSLAGSFSYVPQKTKNVLIVKVFDVQSLGNYKKINEELTRLELVNSIDLVSIKRDEIHFAISSEGNSDLLHDALIRSGRFEMRTADLSHEDSSLSFDWINQ